jgi:hypothetical protein
LRRNHEPPIASVPATISDRPPAALQAAEEEGGDDERHVREPDAEVGLQEDEEDGDADGRGDRRESARLEDRAVVVLEDPREEERDRDPRELGRLELEPAADLDPRLRARDALSEDGQVQEDEEREPVEAGRVLEEDPVVHGEEDARRDEAEDGEQDLLARRGRRAASRRSWRRPSRSRSR